jgi:hypothetical protein
MKVNLISTTIRLHNNSVARWAYIMQHQLDGLAGLCIQSCGTSGQPSCDVFKGSPVSILNWLLAGRPGFDPCRGNDKIFSLRHRVQTGSRANPASYTMRSGGGSLMGVKRPGREGYHSHPSSAEIRNAWSYTSTPQYIFMACLVKHRNKFNFISTVFPYYSLCLATQHSASKHSQVTTTSVYILPE